MRITEWALLLILLGPQKEGVLCAGLPQSSSGQNRSEDANCFCKKKIILGPAYDLTLPKNRHLILGWISSGSILCLHLGTPCNTFSRARDSGIGPPRLRSDEYVLGLPNLTRPGDLLAVRIGNCLMRVTAAILSSSCLHGVPASLENPRLSRFWLCPPIATIMRRKASSESYLDFCMLGTPWKKHKGFRFVSRPCLV